MGKTWKDSKFAKYGNFCKKTEQKVRERYTRRSKHPNLETQGYYS